MAARHGRSVRHSAGLVMYRRRDGAVEVFLVHPGGPYWARRDEQAWSIPKGEYDPDAEDGLAAARREVQEETGFCPAGPFVPLPPCRQAGGKWISAWAVESPQLDPTQLRSNTFTLEWPPRSGMQRQFPEVDRGAWFDLVEAQTKLITGQRALLRELVATLK